MIFIGFMGSGKTTIAKEMSKILNIDYVDIDQAIVEETRKSIPQIFNDYGESYFRNLEYKKLKELINEPVIIATGGGTLENDMSYEIIKNTNTHVIFLNPDFDTIYSRIKNDQNRPLAKMNKEELKSLYKKRLQRYHNVADLELDTNKSIENIVSFIYDKNNG